MEYFDDYDIVCMLLEFAGCPGDRFKVASDLMVTFGTLKGILEARGEQLTTVKGVGRKTALVIQSMIPIIRRWSSMTMKDAEKITNIREAKLYCKSLLMGLRNEQFHVVCLNTQYQIIGHRKISDGSLTEVNSYPRMIMETALNYNAFCILLCHNHPGGTPTPSMEDIQATKVISNLMKGIGIRVLDHIIVFENDSYSMTEHGDFTFSN